ncbi:MAG: hypothetical protein ABIY90_16440, partial [Puia sp.]
MPRISYVLCILLVTACTKGQGVHPAYSVQNMLVSGTEINRVRDGFAKETDSLVYDQNIRLIKIVQIFDDSSQYVGEDYDTLYYLFDLEPGDSMPVKMNARSGFSPVPVDHLLYYDGQSRIIRDTNMVGWINNYGYGQGYLASSHYNPETDYGSSGYGQSYVTDTFYLASGNIVRNNEYRYNPPTAEGQPGGGFVYNYKYSSYTNPFYNPGISGTVGIMLNSYFLPNL